MCEVRLNETNIIEGSDPIIILGPNGVGKTKFGTKIAKINNADWISAMRYLQYNTEIQLLTEESAKQQFNSHVNEAREYPWIMSTDLGYLLSKLKVDDTNSAVAFRNNFTSDPNAKPKDTSLQKLTKFWNSLFPSRQIDFSSYKPTIISTRQNEAIIYEIRRMSDGERTALYLAARVIDSDNKIIIIDEPEVHFHSLMAKKFWNELEKIKTDSRFIYITHDLPFAISRNSGIYIILNSETELQVIENVKEIPCELIENILGAASFSFASNKVLFCEGNYETSKDYILYSAYYDSARIPIIPVGGCDNVKKCVAVFNENPSFKNMRAFGIVDVDFWPEEYFNDLPKEVNRLNIHEMENILCNQLVFEIIAKIVKTPAEEIITKYQAGIDAAKKSVKEITYNKYILERIKKKLETTLLRKLNLIKPNISIEVIKESVKNNFQANISELNIEEMFAAENEQILQMLRNTEEFIKKYPGKGIISYLADKLGLTAQLYFDMIINILSEKDSEGRDKELRETLIKYLNRHLPNIE